MSIQFNIGKRASLGATVDLWLQEAPSAIREGVDLVADFTIRKDGGTEFIEEIYLMNISAKGIQRFDLPKEVAQVLDLDIQDTLWRYIKLLEDER